MNVQTLKTLSVTSIAVLMMAGGARISQAQSNFIDTNIDLNYVSTASGSPTVISSGNSINVSYTSGDFYNINGAGASDADTRDGSGAGAFIRLTPAGNGLRETSTQNAGMNTSLINYRFDITIQDVSSGISQLVSLPFQFNNAFKEGSNGGDGVPAFTLPNPTQIGNNLYTFSGFAFTPASAPRTTGGTSATDGSFGLRVQATPVAVPEPGAVATLVGMGMTGAGFLRRRKSALKTA